MICHSIEWHLRICHSIDCKSSFADPSISSATPSSVTRRHVCHPLPCLRLHPLLASDQTPIALLLPNALLHPEVSLPCSSFAAALGSFMAQTFGTINDPKASGFVLVSTPCLSPTSPLVCHHLSSSSHVVKVVMGPNP